jgi:hypothetical protein
LAEELDDKTMPSGRKFILCVTNAFQWAVELFIHRILIKKLENN